MPAAADPSAGPPSLDSQVILNVPKSGRPVNTTEQDDSISDDVIYKDAVGDVSLDGQDHALAPSTNLNIELHSDPVQLGF